MSSFGDDMLGAIVEIRRENEALKARVAELDDGYRSPMEDAIDRCFELVDGKPEWDYPGQLVHLVSSLLEDRARVAELEAERNKARSIARVLAHAYEHDSRPPQGVVAEALGFAVDQRGQP